MILVPRFIDHVGVGTKDLKRFADPMSNEVKMFKWLTKYRSLLTPRDVLIMMKMEFQSDDPRYSVINRLKGFYDVKRREAETAQIEELFE